MMSPDAREEVFMNVSQLMTKDVATCRADDSLTRAAQIMWEHDCGCVPVVDDEGRIQGMITDRDICMAAYTQGKRLDEIPISSAMSREVYAASPNEDVERAADLMSQKRVRRIPVVDGGQQVVGLLSLGDFARSVSGRGANGISTPTFVRTLSQISQPSA
jgi:CBS domain-containing protein